MGNYSWGEYMEQFGGPPDRDDPDYVPDWRAAVDEQVMRARYRDPVRNPCEVCGLREDETGYGRCHSCDFFIGDEGR